VLGSRFGIAGTVYGTIVVMATLVAGAGAKQDAGRLAVIVAATVIVLWIAHVYSHALGETIESGRVLERHELVSVALRELSIPLAAIPPVTALVLGAVGVFKEATAIWLAVGVAFAALAVQGLRYAAIEHLGWTGRLVAVALNLALGLVIIGLKLFVAH
jgi:hypothetical protein